MGRIADAVKFRGAHSPRSPKVDSPNTSWSAVSDTLVYLAKSRCNKLAGFFLLFVEVPKPSKDGMTDKYARLRRIEMMQMYDTNPSGL